MSKHKLDLALVLPSDASACEACVARLVGMVAGESGVESAHVDSRDPSAPKLCLHYDASAVRVETLEQLIQHAGAELRTRYEHISVPVTGLRHERQAKLVEAALAREPGVLHAAVAFGAGRLYVELDPQKTSKGAVLAAAERAGVAAAAGADEHDGHDHGEGEHDHAHGGPFGERSELIFSLICGALTGVGWVLGKTTVPEQVATAMLIAAYGFGAWFTLQEVTIALRARRFEIDFLMLLAAAGAAFLGEWLEGALLLFLFTLGHTLEAFAMSRARNAIAALAKLAPDTALRIDDTGAEHEVPVAALKVGDRVRVKPNTRLPADGFVAEGASSVDQAPITGESVPVDKRPPANLEAARAEPDKLAAEHRVFAGTINGAGALTVVVTKHAGDSTLARVAKLVAEAETQKSPTERFTDRFERLFVPIILAVVVLLLFAWVVIDEPFAKSLYRALAVLVAASPCALAIATPSAILSGVARAARAGVLVKGGAHLEALGRVRAIAFDKTGTLTLGRPTLTDVAPAEGSNAGELLRVAVAVEQSSDHPLASAIVEGGKARVGGAGIPAASGVEAITGFGMRASISGEEVLLGKPGLFTRDGGALPERIRTNVEKLQSSGRSVVVVRAGARFLGALGVMDTPRESAKRVIAELHRLGVEQTIMLTGDNQRVADAVAQHVGIRVAKGDLLPEQKVAYVAELAAQLNHVAMVGDGVNDAPAMAHATVGIAMGAGGSDVALETADVALMADDLRALPFAVGLSRASHAIIRQNLWASLGMVALLVPATIFDFARIGVAVAFHEGSTLLVVANALRLLAYRDTDNGARD